MRFVDTQPGKLNASHYFDQAMPEWTGLYPPALMPAQAQTTKILGEFPATAAGSTQFAHANNKSRAYAKPGLCVR